MSPPGAPLFVSFRPRFTVHCVVELVHVCVRSAPCQLEFNFEPLCRGVGTRLASGDRGTRPPGGGITKSPPEFRPTLIQCGAKFEWDSDLLPPGHTNCIFPVPASFTPRKMNTGQARKTRVTTFSTTQFSNCFLKLNFLFFLASSISSVQGASIQE